MITRSRLSVEARTLDVPGARLYYELRGRGPLVALLGAPMDARSFEGLADRLAIDHTVLATDPRGIYRSPVDDPDEDSTPQLRADDVSRLLTHVGAGSATIIGSSGGAVTALALVLAHPEQVQIVVAHEPPVLELLANSEHLHAATEDIIATHARGDILGAWAKFMAQANIELPEGTLEYMFGSERDQQQLADERRFFAHELRATTHWCPDLAKLRSGGTRILVGVGQESAGQLAYRTSLILAAALGLQLTAFPGGHTGFADDAEGFALRLRAVLHQYCGVRLDDNPARSFVDFAV